MGRVLLGNRFRLLEYKTGALYNRTPVNALIFRARVPPAGFEPATNRVEADCSNPLSYGGIAVGILLRCWE